MFDFLKKRIDNFLGNFSEAEKKDEAAVESPPVPEPLITKQAPEIKENSLPQKIETKPEVSPEPKPKEPKSEPQSKSSTKLNTKTNSQPAPQPKTASVSSVPKPETSSPIPEDRERVKLGVVGALKSIITGEAEISEKEARETLENLELELLEADVDIGVATFIKEELEHKLIGAKVPRGKLHDYVNGSIREVLSGVLQNEKTFDLVPRIVGSPTKPVVVVFLGINGAGKTTTIAKVAHALSMRGQKVVLAAADTFRAAAIEQMQVHAERLNLKLIKREYGSDPTSVAYDAVNFAKAHAYEVVLVDTAGRQDTNISLLNELKKMQRVIKPDLRLYIGESIAGNAIVEQVSSFNREIGVDGVILTKLDLDAKGGTVLSINRATGVPIIALGTGQAYDDLEPFVLENILRRILG